MQAELFNVVEVSYCQSKDKRRVPIELVSLDCLWITPVYSGAVEGSTYQTPAVRNQFCSLLAIHGSGYSFNMSMKILSKVVLQTL